MFEPRHYQTQAVNDAWYMAEQGERPILCAPTGSGKSVIAAWLAERAMNKRERVGLMTPRRELVKQITGTFEAICYPENVTVLMAGCKWQRERPVHVISDSTIKVRSKKSDVWLPELDTLLVDEAHLSLAKGTQKVLDHYKDSGAKIIGLTATPARQTGKGMGSFYTKIKHVTSVRQLTKEGYLCPLEYYVGKLTDVRKIRTVRGDFETKALADRSIKLVGDVFQNWCRLASDRQTIVFAVDIAHAEALNAEFQSGNIASAVLHSKIDEAERSQIDADFKAGRIQVLVNVTIASYGYDAPKVGCIVLARPTQSIVLHLQMCGRGMRVMEGKTECLVLDHADNVRRLGRADDLYRWRLDENATGCENWTRHEAGEKKTTPVTCPECSYLFESSPRCPKCGWKPAPRQQQVDCLEDAELALMSEKKSKTKEKIFPAPDRFYQMLKGVCAQKGYEPGWVAVTYKKKLKQWPPREYENLPMIAASPEVLGYIKHLQIRRAHARKKRQAA